ncbi:taste receptor type 2 member 39-like [Dendropsophus ebraccatus]|uniref:taste receptor type 2 member 39-like n=1 Tax=Dendropsophus ebraccatus TaxID=150705 RepID=UPI003831F4A2
MSSPNSKAFLAVLLLETITGLSSSIFIIICLYDPATKCQRFSTLNRILMALSASNMSFLFTMSTHFLLLAVWPKFYNMLYVFYPICYLTLYSITSTCWLTSALSIFYFLKIIPSQSGILTKLKNMLDTMTGGLLLVPEVVSFSGSFLSLLISNPNSFQTNATKTETEDLMVRKVSFNGIVMALNFLPFIIAIVTTVISASLLKHYDGQMKKKIGHLNAKVKDYRTAVHTMSALLMFYTSMFLILIFFLLKATDTTTWGYWICVMLLFSHPTVQSAILIHGNPNLKEELRKLFTIITQ